MHMSAAFNSETSVGQMTEDKAMDFKSDFKSTFSKKGLHFLHLNVRSLPPKIEEIRQLVKKSEVGVICLTESRLD